MDKRTPEAAEFRKLYGTARWRKLRQAQLVDQPLCERHLKRGGTVRADTVHHLQQHKGDEYLFFDPNNLESLCKDCHDSDAQSEDRLGYSKQIGADGWPIDPRHPGNRGG